MNSKERIDTALVRRGLSASREKAQAMIMAGEVYINERRILKPSETVGPLDELTVRGSGDRFVSRGAHKLEKAVRVFDADLKDRIVMDIGASTGGFTDICLRNGAKHVYAIDVGYGQLDWKLRNDPRVTVMERTNARYLSSEMFDKLPDTAVMDVSFISIQLILPAIFRIIGPSGVLYTLIKPQFEAGKEKVGKNGVVRSIETHEEVLNRIVQFSDSIGLNVRHIDFSPITGPEGNIEFLAEIRGKKDFDLLPDKELIHRVVVQAHDHLGRPNNSPPLL